MTQTRDILVPKGKLPADTHAALVDTLFGTTGSFLSGILGGLIVPAVAWGRTHDPVFLGCTLVVVGLAILRLAVFFRYQRAAEADRARRATYWERLYALGAVGFMTAVGITAALLAYRQGDMMATLYAVVIALGCAGALAGRNAGRPMIVYGQMVGVCGPLALVLLLHYDAWYWGLTAMLLLMLISVKSTTKSLNNTLVSALLNGREASIQRTRFSSALDSMAHGLCMGDSSGLVTVINHRLQEFFGLEVDGSEVKLGDLARMIARSGGMAASSSARFVSVWEAHLARRNSSVFTGSINGRIYDFRCEPMTDGGFVVVVEDVTSARLASREIERMAHFDSLTGLPNRIQFHSTMEARFNKAGGLEGSIALLSVDLDQFKEVNDARGHPTGDELLRRVAERLSKAAAGADMVARFGGDEFQVLLPNGDDQRYVEAMAHDIIEALSAGYSIDGHSISIGASIGIAVAPRDAGDADELLRCADMALYHAKAEGKGTFRAFEPALDTAMRRKREIEADLREAIAHDRLELHYQPVVDDRTGQVVACEALVRMRNASGEMVAPTEFIPVAEDSGMIVHLGEWVLRRACQDAMTWPETVRVAVNFSAKQFVLGKTIVGDIKSALRDSGLPADRLEVEITESTIIEAKDALRQLSAISAAGVRISLDDFGTGYSSLSYLRQFPVDKIKIDRSFAQDLGSRASQAVIGSVSVLAHMLDVELVIEGIETKDQLLGANGWDVHLIQGYYFSRPKPLAELLPMLHNPSQFAPTRIDRVA